MEIGNEVFAIDFSLLPNVENSRNLFLDFVVSHESRCLLKRRSPAIDKLIVPSLAVLDNIVGEVEKRQAAFDFH